MIQPGSGFGFALKAQPGLRVFGDRIRQEREFDKAVERNILAL